MPTFATTHTFCAARDGIRKLGFLKVVAAKTAIFLHERRSWQGLLESEKKSKGNQAFFRDN